MLTRLHCMFSIILNQKINIYWMRYDGSHTLDFNNDKNKCNGGWKDIDISKFQVFQPLASFMRPVMSQKNKNTCNIVMIIGNMFMISKPTFIVMIEMYVFPVIKIITNFLMLGSLPSLLHGKLRSLSTWLLSSM